MGKKSPDAFLGHLNMQMIYKSCRHFASPFIPSDSVLVLTFGNTEINLLNQAKVYSQSLPIFLLKTNKWNKVNVCIFSILWSVCGAVLEGRPTFWEIQHTLVIGCFHIAFWHCLWFSTLFVGQDTLGDNHPLVWWNDFWDPLWPPVCGYWSEVHCVKGALHPRWLAFQSLTPCLEKLPALASIVTLHVISLSTFLPCSVVCYVCGTNEHSTMVTF